MSEFKLNVFDSYKAIHGRDGMWVLKDQRLKKFKLDDSVFLCTVVDKPHDVKDLPLLQSAGATVLVYEKEYVKWITKVEVLRSYIEANFDKLPAYIMYADAFDCCLVSDLASPQEMLNYYGCDVLFNGEGNFTHDGMFVPERCHNESYWKIFYDVHGEDYKRQNNIKYGARLEKGLNAGCFIGKKQAIYDMVSKAYEYMSGDCADGFPYGCTSDQQVFRYIQIKNYDTISVDVFNKFFLQYIYKDDSLELDDPHHYNHFDRYRAFFEKAKENKV